MTPTERDKNRYATMVRAQEAYGRLLDDETGAPHAHFALAFRINQIAHDIRAHLDDENLSAEERRVFSDSLYRGKFSLTNPRAPRCGLLLPGAWRRTTGEHPCPDKR